MATGAVTIAPAHDELAELVERLVACKQCPRLVAHREESKRARRAAFRGQSYWARPVPGFGDPDARILLVGLAPATHGSNRTGRMFTGDGSAGAGTTLISALHRAGLANRADSERAADGLALSGVYLTSVVHCAPPGNRPRREEIVNCLPYLREETQLLGGVRAVVALGQVAFDGCLQILGLHDRRPRPRFAHGARLTLPDRRQLLACYHPSRQNTQTGRLSPDMLDRILEQALALSR